MYNHQLDTFIAVARTGSFSKAAQEKFITPSAVIQQINNLESSLKVKLFARTNQGVELTEAGELLYREGRKLISISEDICRQVQALQEREKAELHVGTNLLQKCRLFYELWMRFDGAGKGYTIQMSDVRFGTRDIEEVDFMEGIRDGEGWQKKKDFLPLATVPIACAVPKKHPLARKKLLTYEDMKSTVLVTIKKGMSQDLDRLQEDVRSRGIRVVEVDWYSLSVFAGCEVNQYILQTPLCWHDIHPDLVTIPCEWDYSLPYGFHCKKNPSRPAREFIEFVRGLIEREKFSVY